MNCLRGAVKPLRKADDDRGTDVWIPCIMMKQRGSGTTLLDPLPTRPRSEAPRKPRSP